MEIGKRRSLAVAVCLLAVASIRIAATYNQLSLTFDEPTHFGAGLEYLQRVRTGNHGEHPPLARAMAALGPYLDGARLPRGAWRGAEGDEAIAASPHPDRIVAWMRLGILPFFWLAGLTVFVWARREFGDPAAALAMALFTLCPTVLAHAGLATTDMALAACLTLAYCALLAWARTPGWKQSVLLGLAAAAAAVSKFTALGYFPVTALVALLFYCACQRPGWAAFAAQARARLPGAAIAAAAAALAVWAVYGFSFAYSPLWGMRLPAADFFDAIKAALIHNQGGHGAYLLGETSVKGWWYFFPVALAVKTPIALLFLAAIGLGSCRKHFALPAFMLGILAPAMAGNVNIGVRHVLPVYCALSVLGAAGLLRFMHWTMNGRAAYVLAGLLLAWIAVGGILAHPDYLAYFNEFASAHPERVLVDSDLDWGQDLRLVAARLRAAGATGFSTNIMDEWMHPALDRLPPHQSLDLANPSAGWNVVSLTAAKHATQARNISGIDFASLRQALRPVTPWYETMEPTGKIGGLRLYWFPARP